MNPKSIECTWILKMWLRFSTMRENVHSSSRKKAYPISVRFKYRNPLPPFSPEFNLKHNQILALLQLYGIRGRRKRKHWWIWEMKSTNRCCVLMEQPLRNPSPWNRVKNGPGNYISQLSFPLENWYRLSQTDSSLSLLYLLGYFFV